LTANPQPLGETKGRVRVVVIKGSWRLAPWADLLYGLDRGWWIANKGAAEFRGLKASPSPTAAKLFTDIRLVRLKSRAELLTKEKGVIGCGLKHGGGHSGFQAINLAVQFGVKRILLVGFDMMMDGHRAHWREDSGVGKPDAGRIRSWREAFDECAPQFRTLGVDVVNCTMASALTAYPKVPLSEALWA
jgi:hypothetical protein